MYEGFGLKGIQPVLIPRALLVLLYHISLSSNGQGHIFILSRLFMFSIIYFQTPSASESLHHILLSLVVMEKLSSDTIRSVCSGQVITSPYSIVKELTENALDARASIIEIRLVSLQLTSYYVS